MLEIKNIVRIYKPKKGAPVRALDGVNLRFPDTGMIFILGKSGSGKSTLLNVMGGLDKYDSGEIIIKEKSSKDFKQDDFDSYRNTYLGFIFQEYNILNEFSVGINIALALQLQGRKATDEEINAILEAVDLAGYGNRKPNELSGGQKQRVAIARALVKNPQIIMADEPTGALDSATGLQVFDTLKKLSKNKLVITVTHDREFAEQYGDRVIELKDGKVTSDITKYKETAEGGELVVTDKVIQIKKGYQLSAEDLELINRILSDDDAVISFDKKLNDGLRTSAKLDEEGNREAFRETDNATVETKDTTPFKLIKSRLPAKHMFKMGSSSLRNKPIRLAITILLSMIAFGLFGLADTISAYDRANTLASSLTDSSVNYLSFSQAIEVKYTGGSYYIDTNMAPEDIEQLELDTGIEFSPVYNGNSDLGISNLNGSVPYNYYTQTVSGFCEFEQEELSDLGFPIVGRLPQTFGEIAITDYIFEHFQEGGYRYDNVSYSASSDELSSAAKFLAETPKMTLGNKDYTVTGIVDTNLNETRYESLKTAQYGNDISFYLLMSEMRAAVDYGYHALAFVKKGFIAQKMEEDGASVGIDISGFGNVYLNDNANSMRYSANHLYQFSQLDEGGISYVYMGEGDTLKEGEVMLNFELAYSYFFSNDQLLYASLDYARNEMLSQYIEDNYQLAYDNGFKPEDWGYGTPTNENEKRDSFYNYLNYYGYRENAYGPSVMELYATFDRDIVTTYLEANPSLLDEMFDNVWLQYYMYNSSTSEPVSVSVKGFVFSKNIEDYDYSMVVSESIYNVFEEYDSGIYSFAIAKMPGDTSEIKQLAEYNYSQEGEKVFRMKNEVSYILDEIDMLLEPLAIVFLYVGLGLALFAALMLMNYISTSITYKKREIGILRAVGARSSDVFGIFFSESLIIASINFVLSLIAVIASVIAINVTLRGQYGLLLTILNFGPRQAALMLGVSLLVAFVGSFLPVYRIARKRPIDAINNR